jgi:hypothetical protein
MDLNYSDQSNRNMSRGTGGGSKETFVLGCMSLSLSFFSRFSSQTFVLVVLVNMLDLEIHKDYSILLEL